MVDCLSISEPKRHGEIKKKRRRSEKKKEKKIFLRIEKPTLSASRVRVAVITLAAVIKFRGVQEVAIYPVRAARGKAK